MAFRWRANDDPLIVLPYLDPLKIKQRCKVGTPLAKLSGSAHGLQASYQSQVLYPRCFLAQPSKRTGMTEMFDLLSYQPKVTVAKYFVYNC